MTDRIYQDHARFRAIVKGKIKQDLKKYIAHSEMIVKKGKDQVRIPLPQIDIPQFRFENKQQAGVGQGSGNIGDRVQPSVLGKAGGQSSEHALEVDFTLEELAEMLGEQLELPKIEPRENKVLKSKTEKYTAIAHVGPSALRHFKRTFRETLCRQMISGLYDPDHPVIIPIKKDMRYRSCKSDIRHETNAVIIYMMDVSGSMGDEQKEIVRTETFWIDTWLRSQYRAIETRYIIHDAIAREVDEDTFFKTRESGGTLISSAYKLCEKIIETDYSFSDWNIYPFHFSDGDNWSGEDTQFCLQVLEQKLLAFSNVFCYGQVESRYGSGQFLKDLKGHFGTENHRVILSQIHNKEGILQSIKYFLGKGK